MLKFRETEEEGRLVGFKDAFKNFGKPMTDAAVDAVRIVKHDVADAASEARHHAAAQAAQAKREGGSVSLGDTTRSLVSQLREEGLSKVDSLKRAIRKNI